jgi:hypothetical protein
MGSIKKLKLRFIVASAVLATAPVLAEVTHQNTNPSVQITYVSQESWQPEGFVNGITVPAQYLASADVTLDGRDIEPEWQGAVEVEVPLQYGNVGKAVIKAMYTQDEVFIRVRWPDTTENREHRPWTWNEEQERYVEGPQVEDSLLLSFEAGCEWEPSLVSGYSYDFDGWHWMAARSDPLGQAVDVYGNVRTEEMARRGFSQFQSRVVEADWTMKFTENHDGVDLHADWYELDRVYMLQPVSQTVQFRAVPDGGRTGPPFAEKLAAPSSAPDDETQIFPQYSPVLLTGGAGEVQAKGHWEDGHWTVEFRRDRLTPAEHIYDTIFNRLIQFSIHVFNDTDRVDQVSESPRLFLRFLPEETPLLVEK